MKNSTENENNTAQTSARRTHTQVFMRFGADTATQGYRIEILALIEIDIDSILRHCIGRRMALGLFEIPFYFSSPHRNP